MTPRQQELLDHEKFIAEVERIRAKDKERTAKWLDILNSSAMTALITVALGGILGNMFVSKYQDKQKQNAVAQEQYQVFVGKQSDVVEHAIDLVGAGQFDSASLLTLTQHRFNVRDKNGKIPPSLQTKRDEILLAHEAYLRQWATESFKAGVLMNYYFLGRASVRDSWANVVDSLNGLENCAGQKYDTSNLHGPISSPTDQLCVDEKRNLNQGLSVFSQSLNEARTYAWQNFSSIAKSSRWWFF